MYFDNLLPSLSDLHNSLFLEAILYRRKNWTRCWPAALSKLNLEPRNQFWRERKKSKSDVAGLDEYGGCGNTSCPSSTNFWRVFWRVVKGVCGLTWTWRNGTAVLLPRNKNNIKTSFISQLILMVVNAWMMNNQSFCNLVCRVTWVWPEQCLRSDVINFVEPPKPRTILEITSTKLREPSLALGFL